MKNIHVLPTDKPSRLAKLKLFGKDKYNLSKEILPIQDEEQYQNIYITSTDKPNEGDWVFDTLKNACPVIRQLTTEEEVLEVQTTEFKIILATDTELIKDGIQPIGDDFLEWFVNNPSCEEVGFEYQTTGFKNEVWQYDYILIIPQEKLKQETIEDVYFWDEIMYGNFDLFFERYPKQESKQELKVRDSTNFGIITEIKEDSVCFGKNKIGVDIWYKKSNVKLEPKQETIEEAAKSFAWEYNEEYNNYTEVQKGFIEGAKSEAAKQYWFEQFNKLKQ